ncbi:MAG: M23 family metallopeptidase [Bacteroidia bacterium]|nr:M23 family metallopeptidase [Bacteroidia bacterium]MDW8014951.1 M23 family metallopeptidase [Bacteroidia bacterium]
MNLVWLVWWSQLRWPIEGPITLTGSYGEIRGINFHTGIDISVGERIGEVPVLAAADGYVYRLRVSHTGFGKVVYVRHPHGLVTVYGHLSHFAPQGEQIVESLQKQQRRFEVEKFLSEGEWSVKAGDTIGWAGNSGYSFGPHLHFEVRTSQDKPLLPLRYLPTLQDTEPPVFFRVGLRPLSIGAHVEGRGENVFLRLKQKQRGATYRQYECPDTIRVGGRVGVVYTAGDRAGGGRAWLGLRRLALYDSEGKLLYQAEWETLDFDWRRFLRWHVDFAYQQVYRIGIARAYESNDLLPWSKGKGWIEVPPNQVRCFLLQAEDYAGNWTQVRFYLRSEPPPSQLLHRPLDPRALWSIEEGLLLSREVLVTRAGDTIAPHKPLALKGKLIDSLYALNGRAYPTFLKACCAPGLDYTLALGRNCTLHLYRETLQETLYLRVEPIRTPWGEGFLIGDPFIPLRFPAQLWWEVPSSMSVEKSYPLYRLWDGGQWSPVSGAVRRGKVWRIPVRTWGAYILGEDTFPPRIRPLRGKGLYYLIAIEDLGSGVDPYALRVTSENGIVYPEYYEPQRLLYLPRSKGRHFVIEASDRVGNRTRREIHY